MKKVTDISNVIIYFKLLGFVSRYSTYKKSTVLHNKWMDSKYTDSSPKLYVNVTDFSVTELRSTFYLF